MPRHLLLALLAAAALGSASATSRAADLPMRGDVAASAVVWRTFDSDGVFEFQGSKDESVEDLHRDDDNGFKTRTPGTTCRPRVEEVRAQGDMAFVRSVWELHVPAQGEGAPDRVAQRNRSLDVFSKHDGRRRIIRSIDYPEKAPG